ncbi:MAG: hypothetical protein GY753_18295 [Gammaproteobacteria bacterium]|nr:hypothetical protein [Gammaproteobacteria bacterium]
MSWGLVARLSVGGFGDVADIDIAVKVCVKRAAGNGTDIGAFAERFGFHGSA